jgi:hypothetical protein
MGHRTFRLGPANNMVQICKFFVEKITVRILKLNNLAAFSYASFE